MAGRHRQKGYPVRVISEHLEDMAAGYDPVELPPKIELQRIRLDPDHRCCGSWALAISSIALAGSTPTT